MENEQLGQLGTVKSFGIIVSSDLKSDLDLTVPIGCARLCESPPTDPMGLVKLLGLKAVDE